MSVKENLNNIELKIKEACKKVNRDPNDITIIGITKYVTMERTKELLQTEIKDLGENRVEELQRKYNEIGHTATWHFVGTLQSRKVKDVIDKVSMLHSLDRLSVAKQINNRRKEPLDCFVQVNTSGEASKHGLESAEVLPFIKSLSQYDNLRVVGLMTMAPHIDDKDEIRHVFQKLRNLRDSIEQEQFAHAPCHFLSMGMSNDYEIAIEEGATHIRLGTMLVGEN